MRILTIADEPDRYLWSENVREALSGVDMIISCGDLPAEYLDYLVTFTAAPVFYVHGNHDTAYIENPPTGCVCIDDKLVTYKGIRMLGLGGSIRYNNDSPFQFTQKQMKHRAFKLLPKIYFRKGFDILVAHSGAFGTGDVDDRAHVGFEIFNDLIDKWKPMLFIHGHSHLNYSTKNKRLTYRNKTQVINAFEKYFFDIDDHE